MLDTLLSIAFIVGLIAWGFTGSRKKPATDEQERAHRDAGIW